MHSYEGINIYGFIGETKVHSLLLRFQGKKRKITGKSFFLRLG
jgi:hypothetical protein